MNRNRFHNARNDAQGAFKKVLCVCSAGLLRSPTAAWVLSNHPFNFNTRAAGLSEDFALIPIDPVLLHWADEIVCMSARQMKDLEDVGASKPIVVLGIADNYEYRDPDLVNMIRERYIAETGFVVE